MQKVKWQVIKYITCTNYRHHYHHNELTWPLALKRMWFIATFADLSNDNIQTNNIQIEMI